MLHNRYKVPGGEDVSTHMQVDLLRAYGHDVELVEESNERVDELGTVRTAARAIWSPEAKHRVEDLLSRSKFDVMHVQNFFPLWSPSVYYAAKRHGVPVVQSLRNFRLICPEGMLYREGQVCTECVGKRFASPGIRYSCYRGSKVGTAVVAAMSASHGIARTWKDKVALYVTPSDYATDMYVEGGWDPQSLATIPNFVYPDPGIGLGEGGYALYVGRLAPPKGIDTLLRAWRSTEVTYPLRIAGDGPIRPTVERAAATDPLITYLGPVSPEKASALMGDATLVVVPTVGIETFGRVAAEALAKGTPAIVSDLGGLAEIIEQELTGFRTVAGDPHQLADRIMWMVEHREAMPEMRKNARNAFVTRFSSEQAIQSWTAAYTRAIDKP